MDPVSVSRTAVKVHQAVRLRNGTSLSIIPRNFPTQVRESDQRSQPSFRKASKSPRSPERLTKMN